MIYRYPRMYRWAMNVLQRWRSRELDIVSAAIEPGSRVVDLCCGDAALAARVRRKGCTYIGLDVNDRFVRFARARANVEARLWDAERDPIPEADVVCLLSSLYQFIPNDKRLLERMLMSARTKVIIAEPVQHLASSRWSVLRRAAGRATRVGGRTFPRRHTRQTLLDLVQGLPAGSVEIVDARRVVVLMIAPERSQPA